jgi:leucyl aminopeptidase
MRILFHTSPFDSLRSDFLCLGLFEEKLDEVTLFRDLDRHLDGQLSRLATEEKFKGKEEDRLLLHTLGKLPFPRILLLGLGKREVFQVPDSMRFAARSVRAARKTTARVIALAIPPIDSAAQERAVHFLTLGALLGAYRFEHYQTKDSRSPDQLEQLVLLSSDAPLVTPHLGPLRLSAARGELVASAVRFARDLVNEPASVLTPTKLAELAVALAEEEGLSSKVLGAKECDKAKLRLLGAVARGSVEEPRFIHLAYKPRQGSRSKRKVALVGKGITFDAGGLSLKPSSSMEDMKTDMAGAAVLLGVARVIQKLALRTEVHFLIPACENMPSGSAFKLGDVYLSLGGKSVEITNCDAEGRLILADALAYALKLDPDEVIDLATLTGACVVALGPHTAGVMGNDRAMIERLLAAARRVGEEVWPLPLPERLKEQLKSPVADLKNSGERWGGALTAGLFLKEFVGDTPWAHLDIAGPSSADKEWGHITKGGTGFGVATILEYLKERDELA